MGAIQKLFVDHGPVCLDRIDESMPGNHRKAIEAIVGCRTIACGITVYDCEVRNFRIGLRERLLEGACLVRMVLALVDFQHSVFGCHGDSPIRPALHDRRIFTATPHSSPIWDKIYDRRSSLELINSRLDNSFGFENHYIRGRAKTK